MLGRGSLGRGALGRSSASGAVSSAPAPVVLALLGTTTTTVMWDLDAYAGSDVHSDTHGEFRVAGGGGPWTRQTISSGDLTEFTVTGLTDGVKYEFRFIFEDGEGETDPSDVVTAYAQAQIADFSDITGEIHEYDANLIAGTDGQEVTLFEDSIGASDFADSQILNLTTPNYFIRVINNQDVVRANGTTDLLTGGMGSWSLGSEGTFVFIGTFAGAGALLGITDGSGLFDQFKLSALSGGTVFEMWTPAGFIQFNIVIPPDPDRFLVIIGDWGSGVLNLYQGHNLKATGAGDPGDNAATRALFSEFDGTGASDFLAADLNYLGAYNKRLSEAERQNVVLLAEQRVESLPPGANVTQTVLEVADSPDPLGETRLTQTVLETSGTSTVEVHASQSLLETAGEGGDAETRITLFFLEVAFEPDPCQPVEGGGGEPVLEPCEFDDCPPLVGAFVDCEPVDDFIPCPPICPAPGDGGIGGEEPCFDGAGVTQHFLEVAFPDTYGG